RCWGIRWRRSPCGAAPRRRCSRRGANNLTEITADTVVELGDTVVLLGPEVRLAEATLLFSGPPPTPSAAP
ncbi:MAG: hypothetical protein K8J09_02450, partial [Planctomycetes bacterium]|nr:hypothetical protein [Planctomycetota bacterium]